MKDNVKLDSASRLRVTILWVVLGVVAAPIGSTTASAQTNIPKPITHGPFAKQLDVYRVRADALEPNQPQRLPPVLESTQWSPVVSAAVSLDPIWWQPLVSQPLGLSSETIPIDVAGMTQTALSMSPHVKSVLTEPEIVRTEIIIADAEFDSLAFVEAKYADSNTPVGSRLTTGDNSSRFKDQTLTSSAGVKQKSRYGGQVELVQRGGFQNNNSTFLIPNPQGTTRLELNFTQPLMRDRGRMVNSTRLMLAQVDLQLANGDAREELEDHLITVAQTYWDLYQARSEWLQKQRLVNGATSLRDILAARSLVDSVQRQVLRAEAAVSSRQSDLVRVETRIRNAQARLRMLTGNPSFARMSQVELTPQDLPFVHRIELSMREATLTALDNRADVAQSIREVQSVSTRVDAAKNQVLPRLDLILSSYVAGLDSNSNTLGAFTRQFSDGRPSYAAGFLFEVPIGNRSNKARLERNRWELNRSIYDFQQKTEVALTDVEIALRETQTTFDEMLAKKNSILAAKREVDYLQERWEYLPDPNESAVLLIENLLDAQERLAGEEQAYVTAEVAYAVAWIQLQKSMGTLLRFNSAPASADSLPLDTTPIRTMPIDPMPIDPIPLDQLPERELDFGLTERNP